MIGKIAPTTPRLDPDLQRWQALTPREKLAEFSELTQSPYWQFLPEEIKTTIRTLLDR